MVEEAIRDRVPFGGFPWGRLAFSQSDSPLTALAAWGGAPLLTFAVALGGGLLVVAHPCAARGSNAGRARDSPRVPRWPACWRSPSRPLLIPRPTAAEQRNAVVAAIQGSVPRTGLDALGQKRAVTRNHVAETAAARGRRSRPARSRRPISCCGRRTPPISIRSTTPPTPQLLSTASAAIGRPILVGAVLDGPGTGHVRNTGLLWGPSGYLGQMYIKRHPVPFAEYLPGRSIIQKIVTRYAHDQPNDFVAGKTAGLFTIPGPKQTYRLGDVICFEVAYDGLVRSVVDEGRTADRRADQQRQLRAFGGDLPAARHGPYPRGRARARRRRRGDQRAERDHQPQRLAAGAQQPVHPAGAGGVGAAAHSLTLADRLGGWTELVLVALGALGLLPAIRWPQTRVYRVPVAGSGAVRRGRRRRRHQQ